jgi:hypothetical protein
LFVNITMLSIPHISSYSRLQLVLRMVFGMLYIALPHALPLMVLAVASVLLMPVAWAAVLLTGRYPRALFDFEVGLLAWQYRVNASLYNLVDGYPAFGLRTDAGPVHLSVPFPERLGRLHLLLKLTLGWAYCALPHALMLLGKGLLMLPAMAVAAVAVLISGAYPKVLHRFCVNTLNHALRVRLYMGGMTDTSPSFR